MKTVDTTVNTFEIPRCGKSKAMPMSRSVPSFTGRDEKYQADACQGLVRGAAEGRLRLEALVHGHYPGRTLPRDILPSVKSVGFWDAPRGQDWGLDWHRNEGIELTLLETGRLGFATSEHVATLQADDLTITRPWQQHRVGDPRVAAGRLHWLILDVGVRWPDQPWRWPPWIVLSKTDRNEITDFLRHNEQPVWPGCIDARRCFQQIAEAVQRDRDGSSASALAVRLNELLLVVLDVLRGGNVVLDESLAEKRRTVELFLAEISADVALLARPWTVGRMAQACGLGETRFAHYCKMVANMTPMRYLSDQRLLMAARLLRDHPQQTVAQIAAACGFASPQYFATTFKRRFGRAPRHNVKQTAKPSRCGPQSGRL